MFFRESDPNLVNGNPDPQALFKTKAVTLKIHFWISEYGSGFLGQIWIWVLLSVGSDVFSGVGSEFGQSLSGSASLCSKLKQLP